MDDEDKCHYCDLSYQTETELVEHLREEHTQEELSRIDQRRVNSRSDDRTRRVTRRAALAATGAGLVGVVGVGGWAVAQSGPTEIKDWNDLDDVRNNLGDDYELTADLDSSTAGYDTHVGNPADGWEPIGGSGSQFSGKLNGNGHEIADLTIDRQSATDVGLFGRTSGATLENISLSNAAITGDDRVGALVGRASQTTVTQVHAAGQVTGNGGQGVGVLIGFCRIMTVTESSARGTVSDMGGTVFNFGGLVGRYSGTLERSFADVTVNAGSAGQVGGLVGKIGATSTDTTVRDSYATGAVTGSDFVGGVIGVNDGSDGNALVEKSYATGAISGATTGGVVGSSSGNGSTVQDSYWDTQSTGQNVGIGSGPGSVTGLTTTEMQGTSAETNMSALDFTSPWQAVESGDIDAAADGYPILESVNRKKQLEVQGIFDPPTAVEVTGENVTFSNTTVSNGN